MEQSNLKFHLKRKWTFFLKNLKWSYLPNSFLNEYLKNEVNTAMKLRTKKFTKDFEKLFGSVAVSQNLHFINLRIGVGQEFFTKTI